MLICHPTNLVLVLTYTILYHNNVPIKAYSSIYLKDPHSTIFRGDTLLSRTMSRTEDAELPAHHIQWIFRYPLLMAVTKQHEQYKQKLEIDSRTHVIHSRIHRDSTRSDCSGRVRAGEETEKLF